MLDKSRKTLHTLRLIKKQNEPANSVDPDEMVHDHESSHLDLHSLSIFVFRSIVLNGLKYFKNSAM